MKISDAVWAVWVGVMLAAIVLSLVPQLLAGGPDAEAMRAICAKRGKVRQVAPSKYGSITRYVVVCNDGWVGEPK